MGVVLASTGSTLWSQLSVVFTALLGWVADVLTALTSPASGGADLTGLLPFLAIPIAFTVIGFGVGLIKRVIG